MPNFLDLLTLFFSVHDLSKEYLSMITDYAGWAAVLVFLGGLTFWAMIIFAAVVGLCRGVKRLYDSAVDVFRGRRFKPAE